MDQARYSRIAHGRLPLWNPVGACHLESYIDLLAFPACGRILEIGCGRGYLLGLLLARSAVCAIGVDSSPYAIAAAKTELSAWAATGRLTLVERPFDAREYESEAFDMVICVGATHAAGGYQNTFQTAKRLLKANGLLFVGEGYWKDVPSQAYLTFLQMNADDQFTHQGNQSAGTKAGFDLLSCSETSLAEWDDYEDQYARNVEDYVEANPHDPDADAMLQRIERWRDGYLRWGRETLGFGLYLFRVRSNIVQTLR